MSTWNSLYRKKLVTLEDAAARVTNGDTIVPGMANGEPIGLLAAIADRARRDDLTDLRVFSLHPTEYAASTVLSPDLCDRIQAYSWFGSRSGQDAANLGAGGKQGGRFRADDIIVLLFGQQGVAQFNLEHFALAHALRGPA